MAAEPSTRTSFSALRRWGIFLSVLVSIAAVIALVIMANYLGARYFTRLTWSAQTRMPLTPRTLGLLKTITNDVRVIVYYDKTDQLYSYITDLLTEYRLKNPKITVETVDYLVDFAAAQRVKADYKLSAAQKDILVFDCDHKHQILPGAVMAPYSWEKVASETETNYNKNLNAFNGEMYVSAELLSVINPNKKQAYYLTGHGEPSPVADTPKDSFGYFQFCEILAKNNLQPNLIQLTGTNAIPADCSLLIIAGPHHAMATNELDKISQYLKQGGRLLSLFNYNSITNRTGLESVLADWGVEVGMNIVRDPDNTTGQDVVVNSFNVKHALVQPLEGSYLQMLNPRSIGKATNAARIGAQQVQVTPLAFTGPNGQSSDGLKGQIPLMVAVEGKAALLRGSTRIVVVGDSTFLSNTPITYSANSDFAEFAINWLMEQTFLLEGIGPHPLKYSRMIMTTSQMDSIRWIFLGAMPGGILALGSLVWLRRRH